MRNVLFAVVGALALLEAFGEGVRAEVKVSEFGFDPVDATRHIQSAIDSGDRKSVV